METKPQKRQTKIKERRKKPEVHALSLSVATDQLIQDTYKQNQSKSLTFSWFW